MTEEKQYAAKQISIKVRSTFDEFTKRLENAAGRFDPSVLSMIKDEPGWVEEEISRMQGEQDLMIFAINNHGIALLLAEVTKKAKLYSIGNPLIAIKMTSLNLESALYLPLRLLVYEADNKDVYALYDLPSSIFKRFNNDMITDVALLLDVKLKKLVDVADKEAIVLSKVFNPYHKNNQQLPRM